MGVLSVTEGDDKPAKHPLLFSRATMVVLSKCDLIAHTNFNVAKAVSAIRVVNHSAPIIETGIGLAGDDQLDQWLFKCHQETTMKTASRVPRGVEHK